MDKEYAGKIRKFYEKFERMPSFEEVRKLLGFASKQAVSKLINRLAEKNILKRDAKGKLIPLSLTASNLSLLGIVEAGFPTEAYQESSPTMSLDEFVMGQKTATFMLKVKGDSMKDAGILEGDYVVVERTDKARIGEIVIASVDGAFTMKYLRQKKGAYYLEAANRNYKDIHPKDGLKVEAVVLAVIRKYRT